MNIEQNDPTVIISPFRQEVYVFDPNQETGVRVDSEISTRVNLYQHADILGEFAARGAGKYKASEIARAVGIEPSSLTIDKALFLAKLLPEYIAYDRGFEVLKDFSIAMALEQTGDAAFVRTKQKAQSDQNRKRAAEAREKRITSKKDRLDQLVAEAVYTAEEIERMDVDKISLNDYDSVRFTIDDRSDYLIPLTDSEDIICARIFIELAGQEKPRLDYFGADGTAQRIWDAMPLEERTIFSDNYRSLAPKAFIYMYSSIAKQLGRNRAFHEPNTYLSDDEQTISSKPMRHVSNISLLTEEPLDGSFTEVAINRYDKSELPKDRRNQWTSDIAERKNLITELRSMGVYIDSQIKPIQQKARLQYSPESQIAMKAPLTELITSVLSGDTEILTQPQAMEIIHAANNARYYRVLEGLGAGLVEPVSLDVVVDKLNEACKTGLGDSYHGFATHNRTIGRATIKRLRR